jgi:hypothetical protein
LFALKSLDLVHSPRSFRERDVSETGSVAVLRWKGGGRHLLGRIR